MRSTLSLLLLICVPAFAAQAACSGTMIAEYRMTPSLKAAEANTSYRVALFNDRCAMAEFPKQDVRHGTVTDTLSPKEYDSLLSQIRASGVASLDSNALRQELAARSQEIAKSSEPRTLWASSDEDIIEFDFNSQVNKSRPHKVTWTSLHQDLLNHPDNPQLVSLQALQNVFKDLSNRIIERKQEKQQ